MGEADWRLNIIWLLLSASKLFKLPLPVSHYYSKNGETTTFRLLRSLIVNRVKMWKVYLIFSWGTFFHQKIIFSPTMRECGKNVEIVFSFFYEEEWNKMKCRNVKCEQNGEKYAPSYKIFLFVSPKNYFEWKILQKMKKSVSWKIFPEKYRYLHY